MSLKDYRLCCYDVKQCLCNEHLQISKEDARKRLIAEIDKALDILYVDNEQCDLTF